MDTDLRRPAVTVAALASAGAGLVHAAAAGTHQDEQTLVVLFSLCAVAQLGWALLVFAHPRKWLIVAGAALNLGAVATWALSRTAGLPVIDALRDQEPVGRQDLVAALLASVAVIGCVGTLLWPRTTRAINAATVSVLGVCALAAAYVGVAAPHAHGESGAHGHAHDGDVAASAAEPEHEHGDTEEHAHEDEVADEDAAAPDDPALGSGHEHHETPARLDHEPTDAQREDADQLVAATKTELAKYANVNDAVAAGYKSIGDGKTSGFEHYINAAFTANATVLDATQPESLVYRIEADGARLLTTAMYILPPGSTMDDVPDVAGNLTVWHDHQNLCFAPGTQRLAGALVDGQCRPGGELRPTPPMLHVWIVDNACGPFAGTDRQQMTGSCTH